MSASAFRGQDGGPDKGPAAVPVLERTWWAVSAETWLTSAVSGLGALGGMLGQATPPSPLGLSQGLSDVEREDIKSLDSGGMLPGWLSGLRHVAILKHLCLPPLRTTQGQAWDGCDDDPPPGPGALGRAAGPITKKVLQGPGMKQEVTTGNRTPGLVRQRGAQDGSAGARWCGSYGLRYSDWGRAEDGG